MSDDNPFDAKVDEPTKAEPKADEATDTKAAPVDKPKRTRSTAKPKTADAKPAAKPKGPLSDHYDGSTPYDARQGEIQGGVKLHNGVPVAWVKPVNWVGPEPLLIGLNDLVNLRDVADDLISQVEKS